jgi:hypothetical protein
MSEIQETRHFDGATDVPIMHSALHISPEIRFLMANILLCGTINKGTNPLPYFPARLKKGQERVKFKPEIKE